MKRNRLDESKATFTRKIPMSMPKKKNSASCRTLFFFFALLPCIIFFRFEPTRLLIIFKTLPVLRLYRTAMNPNVNRNPKTNDVTVTCTTSVSIPNCLFFSSRLIQSERCGETHSPSLTTPRLLPSHLIQKGLGGKEDRVRESFDGSPTYVKEDDLNTNSRMSSLQLLKESLAIVTETQYQVEKETQ